MTTLAFGRYVLGVCASLIVLADCSSGSQLAPSAAMEQTSVARTQMRTRLATQATLYLFVANFSQNPYDVSMYGLQSKKLVHQVKSEAAFQYSLLDDSAGRLYVMNTYQITVFGPKKKYVDYVISKGISGPSSILLDSGGALYVANGDSSIDVFAPGSKTLVRKITAGVSDPVAMTFDGSGNLFVANSYPGPTVTVYPPGGSRVEKTITSGIQRPVALATDAQGNLYVINLPKSSSGWNVQVYTAGSYSLARTITAGLSLPDSLAFDSSGNLYVGNATNITVYAPGSSEVLRTIPTQRHGFATRAMVFDNSGVLYAAYQGIDSGGVNLYAPGTDTPMLMIRRAQGVAQPVALAIGP